MHSTGGRPCAWWLHCRQYAEEPVSFAGAAAGANRKFVKKPWKALEVARHNKERSVQEQTTRLARVLKRDQQRQKRIQEAGIDYDYESLSTVVPKKPKHMKFDAGS